MDPLTVIAGIEAGIGLTQRVIGIVTTVSKIGDDASVVANTTQILSEIESLRRENADGFAHLSALMQSLATDLALDTAIQVANGKLADAEATAAGDLGSVKNALRHDVNAYFADATGSGCVFFAHIPRISRLALVEYQLARSTHDADWGTISNQYRTYVETTVQNGDNTPGSWWYMHQAIAKPYNDLAEPIITQNSSEAVRRPQFDEMIKLYQAMIRLDMSVGVALQFVAALPLQV